MGEMTLEAETEGMRAASEALGKAQGEFDTALADVTNYSASDAAEMDLKEAQEFMVNERTARNQLAEYMTRTSNGAAGYKSAVDSITTSYTNHSNVSVQRIQALLKQQDGPVPIRGGFVDWTYALQYQHDHPDKFPLPPELGGPQPKAGS
ncbi:hypothetical protein ACIA49_39720 [Kribbella sp. NPDC051587]|uniref:hypothetical protein n=1 Tax=Kribbella sp. NPDC051587 TaxID=3364119 RepID=UPI0037911B53